MEDFQFILELIGAAAFAVSDVLARYKWEPHFGEKPIFRALEDIFIAAQKVLK